MCIVCIICKEVNRVTSVQKRKVIKKQQVTGSAQYLRERDSEYGDLDLDQEQRAKLKKLQKGWEDKLSKGGNTYEAYIKKLAHAMESIGVPLDKICSQICAPIKKLKLKGFVSESWIRKCLPEKYKQEYRVENAKKRQVKLEDEKREGLEKRKRDLTKKHPSEYSREEIVQTDDRELLREIALYQHDKLDYLNMDSSTTSPANKQK